MSRFKKSSHVIVTFPQRGSRDALCSLIGKDVLNIAVQEGRSIEMSFRDGKMIHLSLAESALAGTESVHFVPGENQPIEVW